MSELRNKTSKKQRDPKSAEGAYSAHPTGSTSDCLRDLLGNQFKNRSIRDPHTERQEPQTYRRNGL